MIMSRDILISHVITWINSSFILLHISSEIEILYLEIYKKSNFENSEIVERLFFNLMIQQKSYFMNHMSSRIYLRKGFTLTSKNSSRSWSIKSELRACEPIRVRDWGYDLKPNLCFCLATSFCLSSHSSLKIIWQSNILYFHSFLRIFEITKFHSLEMALMAYINYII